MLRTVLLCGVLTCLSCTSSTDSPRPPEDSSDASIKLETVVSGLRVPWSIVFAPDGSMYLTEREGRVRVVRDGKLVEKPVYTVPDVVTGSEIGLMGLALHPEFATNQFAYLAYGYRRDAVKVVRYKLSEDSMTVDKVVIDAIPAAMNHAGCAIAFGPDQKLYVTTGDATDRDIAQDLGSLGGKTLRLNDDGSIPSDNPFLSKEGARPEIWSYGHRNAQGIAWQPGTDLMWQTEHGPSGFDGPGGGDEINIVPKGQNMGWPLVHHDQRRDGTVPPIVTYTPAEAPGGMAFYDRSEISAYEGNLFFGCLRGNGIMRLVVDGPKVVRQEKLYKELGRCRAVAVGPDGAIYFSTSNRDGRGTPQDGDDRIMRIAPG